MEAFISEAKVVLITSLVVLGAERIQATDAAFTRVAAPFVGVRGGAMAWGDFDNDGDLDVILTGDAGDARTALYRNNGEGTFSSVSAGFAAYRSGAVEWGDYDNDGYLDLLAAGLGGDGLTRIYRNQGGTNFVEFKRFGLNYDGKVGWGDLNNDAKLDFAVCGAGSYNQVYLNVKGTNFLLLNSGMPQLYYGSVGWVDYNRDGNLDLLLTGMSLTGGGGAYVYRNGGLGNFSLGWSAGPWEPGRWIDIDNDGWPDLAIGCWPYQFTYVYRNNLGGGFTQVASLPIGPLAVGDFNNDGWSDLLINNRVMQNSGTGTWTTVNTSLPDMGTSTLINSAFAGDFDNDGRLDVILSDASYTTYLYRNVTTESNAPPGAPGGLQAVASRTNAVFCWNAAADDHQADGVTYNLWVGKSPGGFDVVSPMSGPDGYRRVVRAGNAGTLTQYTLAGLTAGTTYYWSVQAVDNSFAGSAFAAEQSFVATTTPTISAFADQTMRQDSGPLVLPFTVGDLETPAGELVVGAISSNLQLVGSGGVIVSGTGADRNLAITPEARQSGTATITVTVTDADGGQAAQQFQLTVLSNNPPVARIIVSPLSALPGLTDLTVITPLCQDAMLVLDGSQSSDVEGDWLQYAWTEGTNPAPFATNMIVTKTFAPGTYTITLSVNDGMATGMASVQVDVITPDEAVAVLEAYVQTSGLPPGHERALSASLEAAEASFERCHLIPGINQLRAFQSKTRVIVGPSDPSLAGTLIEGANGIIEALPGPDEHGPAGPPRHLRVAHHGNGKVKMEFSGAAGRSYIVEASTNLVNWESIGTAKRRGDGEFEFGDLRTVQFPARYYRIVSPY
jgi:hypothetical protein